MDDESLNPVADGCVAQFVPALIGVHKPESPLSAFDGESLGGTWRLVAHEVIVTPSDGGEVAFWSLIICANAATDTICNNVDADDDNDGCTDTQEAGPNPLLGGMRNSLSYWDFYDVPTGAGLTRDKSVSAPDIFGGDWAVQLERYRDRHVQPSERPNEHTEPAGGRGVPSELPSLVRPRRRDRA